jgi:hypothetical protein
MPKQPKTPDKTSLLQDEGFYTNEAGEDEQEELKRKDSPVPSQAPASTKKAESPKSVKSPVLVKKETAKKA